MLVAQRLALDDVVQVGAHQGGHQVPGRRDGSARRPRLLPAERTPSPRPASAATHTSLKSSMEVAGVNTSSSPMTCVGTGVRTRRPRRSAPWVLRAPRGAPAARLTTPARPAHVLVLQVLEQP